MSSADSAPLILLKNAELFAPDAQGKCQVLIGAGRVLEIQPSGASSPRGVALETVDLHGRRVVPGFIDGHVHVTGGGGEGGFATRIPPLPLHRYTHNGVTSVVGLLGTDDCARTVRELVARPAR